MNYGHDNELPARMCWTVRLEYTDPTDGMQCWVARWPGLPEFAIYSRTWGRVMERIREECLEREGVRL